MGQLTQLHGLLYFPHSWRSRLILLRCVPVHRWAMLASDRTFLGWWKHYLSQLTCISGKTRVYRTSQNANAILKIPEGLAQSVLQKFINSFRVSEISHVWGYQTQKAFPQVPRFCTSLCKRPTETLATPFSLFFPSLWRPWIEAPSSAVVPKQSLSLRCNNTTVKLLSP